MPRLRVRQAAESVGVNEAGCEPSIQIGRSMRGILLLGVLSRSALAMHHARLTQEVRDLVSEVFSQLDGRPCAELRETILISDGSYVGRRFDGPQGHAIWFVEEDQLKFFRPDGSMARVIEPATALPIAA